MEPGPARVQKLGLQEPQVQALVQVAELAQLEPQVQVQLEPQVRLELEQHLQRSNPKPQLHPHRCKAPDRSREPQLELRQTQVHPKALDMTPLTLVQRELQVLEQAQVPEREQQLERAAQLAQELVRRAQQEPLELQARVQELEPAPELHVFLERLPLQQGLTQHI